MAEESFQLEQILKRQYHTDIRQKSEQNRQLALDNQTLRQQLVSRRDRCTTQIAFDDLEEYNAWTFGSVGDMVLLLLSRLSAPPQTLFVAVSVGSSSVSSCFILNALGTSGETELGVRRAERSCCACGGGHVQFLPASDEATSRSARKPSSQYLQAKATQHLRLRWKCTSYCWKAKFGLSHGKQLPSPAAEKYERK